MFSSVNAFFHFRLLIAKHWLKQFLVHRFGILFAFSHTKPFDHQLKFATMKSILHANNEAKKFTLFMLVADFIFISLLFLTHMK
jgi:hypothetical protein